MADTTDKTAKPVTNATSIVAKTDDAVTATAGEYTVAPGRTVDGKGPGQTVKLDDNDALRMLELGFILDTDGAVVIRADGPAVNVEDGVQVKA
jgi:hypothetical protein